MQTRCKKIVRNIIITVISIAIYNIYAFSNTYADDTITITLPSSSVNLPITPTSSGVFNSTDINVQVTTSNTAGYTLSMTAASTNLTRTAAVNETTPIIPTLLSSYSESAFPTGYWGYKLSSDSSFSPIASSITIADPDESTANTAISNVITFAAKLDNSKPAGNYTTTLTFTATGKSTDETWYFNNSIDIEGWPFADDTDVRVNFISNSNEYTSMKKVATASYMLEYNEAGVYYYGAGAGVENPFECTRPGSQLVCVYSWKDQAYRTITITGGDDADNAQFREWLSSNATQL